MLKARAQNGDVIIGLSRKNIEQLMTYEPLIITGPDIGAKNNTFLIFGETEIGIAADLMARGVILNPPKDSGYDS